MFVTAASRKCRRSAHCLRRSVHCRLSGSALPMPSSTRWGVHCRRISRPFSRRCALPRRDKSNRARFRRETHGRFATRVAHPSSFFGVFISTAADALPAAACRSLPLLRTAAPRLDMSQKVPRISEPSRRRCASPSATSIRCELAVGGGGACSGACTTRLLLDPPLRICQTRQ